MKKTLFCLVIIIFLSGCSMYNPYRDPVYQSYLRGEISYDTYVQHVNNWNARKLAMVGTTQQVNTSVNQTMQQRAQSVREANQNLSSSLSQSYNLGSTAHTRCYKSGNEVHCDTSNY